MKLQQILEHNGYDDNDFMSFCEEGVNDSCCVTFCSHCGEEGEYLEPDCYHEHCDNCGYDTLSSVLILAGLI